MSRIAQIKSRMSEISKQIKDYNQRGIYLYEGNATERIHLREITKEYEELDDELFDLEILSKVK